MKRQGVAIDISETLVTTRWLWKRIGLTACLFLGTLAPEICLIQISWAAQGPTAIATSQNYVQEYYEPFKGKPADMRDLRIKGGNDAENQVAFEADGLRITLPPGYPGGRPGVGLSLNAGVKGDFELTVNFEILKEPVQSSSRGTRVTLGVIVNVADRYDGSVSHRINGQGKKQFFTYMATPQIGSNNSQVKQNFFPAEAKTGRLRLVRKGSVLYSYASSGVNKDFMLLTEYPFTTTDLKSVYIDTSTNDPMDTVDVRITDLRLRTDSVKIEEAVTPVPVRRTALWLVAGLFALTLVIGGLWIWWRKVRDDKAEKPPEQPNSTE